MPSDEQLPVVRPLNQPAVHGSRADHQGRRPSAESRPRARRIPEQDRTACRSTESISQKQGNLTLDQRPRTPKTIGTGCPEFPRPEALGGPADHKQEICPSGAPKGLSVTPARILVCRRTSTHLLFVTIHPHDAGASRISVAIDDGGTRPITATDDGAGIRPDEVEVAFERHATSKLSKAEDLLDISTLGFRGEALPNIAAASLLTCLAKTANHDDAVQYVVEFGVTQRPVQCAAAVGNSVKAENLLQETNHATVATVPCRSAVRVGDRINEQEM